MLDMGAEHTLISNDPYKPLLGNKDPRLGEPFLDLWHESCDQATAIIGDPTLKDEANLLERVIVSILLDEELLKNMFAYENAGRSSNTKRTPYVRSLSDEHRSH